MFKFILKAPSSYGIREWPSGGGQEIEGFEDFEVFGGQ